MMISQLFLICSLCFVLTGGGISKRQSLAQVWYGLTVRFLPHQARVQSKPDAVMRPQQVTGTEAPIRGDLPTDFWRWGGQHSAGAALCCGPGSTHSRPTYFTICDPTPRQTFWPSTSPRRLVRKGSKVNKAWLSSVFTDDFISHHGSVAGWCNKWENLFKNITLYYMYSSSRWVH